jgi:hypothetical protein
MAEVTEVTAAENPEAEKPSFLPATIVSPAIPMRVEQLSAARREHRLAGYTQVWKLHRQGFPQNVMAQQAGVSVLNCVPSSDTCAVKTSLSVPSAAVNPSQPMPFSRTCGSAWMKGATMCRNFFGR